MASGIIYDSKMGITSLRNKIVKTGVLLVVQKETIQKETILCYYIYRINNNHRPSRVLRVQCVNPISDNINLIFLFSFLSDH